MKKAKILFLLLITIISAANPSVGQPKIGELNRSQISLGCVLFLWKPNSSNLILSDGLSDDFSEKIVMIIDERLTQLVRVRSSEKNNRIAQTYRSIDNKIIVDFNLRLGKHEYEGDHLEQGTLRVRKGGQQTKVVVVGYNGC